MSIKERRERQKQATRDSILSAALEIARTEGWAAVTVREVAERVEYSPPIIYQYFANKNALLEELQAQGFQLLVARMQSVSPEGTDTRERLLRIGDAYIHFAYDQPELYQLMHGGISADVPQEKTLQEASQVCAIVQEALVAWVDTQQITIPDPAAAVESAWAVLHGLVSIAMLGRLSGGKDRVEQLARQTLNDLFTAWSSPPS
jgi:AcrR family transcriptional regulator